MSKINYRVIGIIGLIVILCFFNFVVAKDRNLPLLSKVIYLDAGHGGLDSGAYYKNIREADLNLAITKKIMKVLKDEGAIVYLTRYGDYDLAVGNAWNRKRSDLSRRANVINKSDCDLYLSIHLNADDNGVFHGAEAYYDTINPDNKKIAKIFQNEFNKHLNSDRQYKENSTKYLQRRVSRPGVLLEVGFLSNPSERALLMSDTYQYKIADTIKNGVNKYFLG
jgi:N-acetylmuramoyl-L-alanine amidase